MDSLLQTKVGDIRDGEILALIDELEHACRVGSRDFVNLPLSLFLTQCVYPDGPAKRVPITTKIVASAPFLESRVGKLPDGPLRDLCAELALLAGTALESFSGNKIYVLLNKTLPKYPTVKTLGAGANAAARCRAASSLQSLTNAESSGGGITSRVTIRARLCRDPSSGLVASHRTPAATGFGRHQPTIQRRWKSFAKTAAFTPSRQLTSCRFRSERSKENGPRTF